MRAMSLLLIMSVIVIGLFVIILCQGEPAMAAGQALNLKHPVVDWKLNLSQSALTDIENLPVLKMTDQQMLSFVPPYGYSQYCECPNCYGGVEGNGVLTWSLDQPEELKCRFCGTVVYPNPKYPEDRVLTGTNSLGEEIKLPYYYNEEQKAPHFFSTHLWLHKRKWLLGQVRDLARGYAITGNEEYARRVVLVLDKIAQVYPHYPVMRNLPRRFSFRESQQPPYVWDSGKWNYFHDEVPIEVLPAYDLVYSSKAFDTLSRERGYDVREKIEQDFLKAAVEAAMAYPDYVSNIIGYSPRSAALVGRVINEPRYVHWTYGCAVQNLTEGFFRDGMWKESPSYHYMTVGGLRSCFEAMTGYSDPAGYQDPMDGTRFDDLKPEEQLPLWGKCLHAPEVIGLPNGYSTCVHDTHPYERRGTPRESTLTTATPGFGHVSLGRGRNEAQMQAQLHFSGGYGHQHLDNLNLTLYAHEREMSSDIGYTWSQMRSWASSSLGHSLVVVDRRDQDGSNSDGNLLCLYPGNATDPEALAVSAVEADGRRGYQTLEGLDLYRRLLVMVPVSNQEAYVVDVFRVRGGSQHEWVLNGDADYDSTAATTVALGEKQKWLLPEGEKWQEPTMEASTYNPYGMVRDVASGQATAPFETTFSYLNDDSRHLRVHMLTAPAQVLLGRSPSVRRMGVGSSADMRKSYDYWLPKLLVRREGQAPLASLFAAVHEPYGRQPFLTSIKRLAVMPDDGQCVALEIRHGNAVDTVFSTLDTAPFPVWTAANGVTLQGRLGVVRQIEGKITGVWLMEGQSFGGPDWRVTCATPTFTGTLTGATRKLEGGADNALLTTAILPAGETLKGQWLIVTLPNGCTEGFQIDHVRQQGNQTAVVIADDHALQIKGESVSEVYFPRRELTGTCTFRLPALLSVVRQPNGAYATQMSSEAEITLPQ